MPTSHSIRSALESVWSKAPTAALNPVTVFKSSLIIGNSDQRYNEATKLAIIRDGQARQTHQYDIQNYDDKTTCEFHFNSNCYDPSSHTCAAQFEKYPLTGGGFGGKGRAYWESYKNKDNILKAHDERAVKKRHNIDPSKQISSSEYKSVNDKTEIVTRSKTDPECVRVKYIPSEWETNWLDNIERLQKVKTPSKESNIAKSSVRYFAARPELDRRDVYESEKREWCDFLSNSEGAREKMNFFMAATCNRLNNHISQDGRWCSFEGDGAFDKGKLPDLKKVFYWDLHEVKLWYDGKNNYAPAAFEEENIINDSHQTTTQIMEEILNHDSIDVTNQNLPNLVFSKFIKYNSCTGEENVELIEPLISHLRHPLSGCVKEFLSETSPNQNVEKIEKRLFRSDRSWAIFGPDSSAIVEKQKTNAVHKYFFDVGSGKSWAENLGYLTDAFKHQSRLDFDYYEAWDPRAKSEEEFYATVPDAFKKKVNFHNYFVGDTSIEDPQYDKSVYKVTNEVNALDSEKLFYGSSYRAQKSSKLKEKNTQNRNFPFLPRHISGTVGSRQKSYVVLKLDLESDDKYFGRQSGDYNHYSSVVKSIFDHYISETMFLPDANITTSSEFRHLRGFYKSSENSVMGPDNDFKAESLVTNENGKDVSKHRPFFDVNKFLLETDLSYIDELIFEHRVPNMFMARHWGNFIDKAAYGISTTYEFLLRLRKVGIRAHSWV